MTFQRAISSEATFFVASKSSSASTRVAWNQTPGYSLPLAATAAIFRAQNRDAPEFVENDT
jgi:hypothetical protein